MPYSSVRLVATGSVYLGLPSTGPGSELFTTTQIAQEEGTGIPLGRGQSLQGRKGLPLLGKKLRVGHRPRPLLFVGYRRMVKAFVLVATFLFLPGVPKSDSWRYLFGLGAIAHSTFSVACLMKPGQRDRVT
jgi:hypothetical protein